MKNRMSLAEWQAALDAERAKGLRRGSTLPKQAPAMQKITEPLPTEPHYTRAKQANRGGLTADQASECFDELVYSQSAGGVFAVFSKDGSQYFYPLSRSEAKEWFDDDLGRYFNAVIR